MNFSLPFNYSTHSDDYLDETLTDQSDYYSIYYDGNIQNLKSIWYREPHFIPLIILYSCVFLIGVIGNGLVIFAIVGSKKTRNITFLFMISLACADLLFLLVCIPIDTLGMLLGHWAGGRVFCKLSAYIGMVSAIASILNLTIISVERYVVIVMPFRSRRNCTTGRTRRILSVVWIGALVLSTPAAVVRDVAITTFYNNSTSVVTSLCGENASDELLFAFAVYQIAIMLVIPTVVMAFCYSVVIHALWISRATLQNLTTKQESGSSSTAMIHRNSSRVSLTYSNAAVKVKICSPVDNRNNALEGRKQIVKMLVTVVVLFILCWGPKLILELFKRLRLDFVYYPEVFQAQIGIYCLTYVQSCVNPVIYGLMCRNFRQSLKYACSALCSCKRSKDDINVILENFSLEVESRYSADNYKKSINRHGTSHMHVH